MANTKHNYSDNEAPRFAVVIVNWNGWQDTLECLESLMLSTESSLDITVVDNGSTDDSLSRIRRWACEPRIAGSIGDLVEAEWGSRGLAGIENIYNPRRTPSVRLIRVQENTGFAKGTNIGLRVAALFRPEYFWLLNNDTVVDKNCASTIRAALEFDRQIMCATGPIVYESEPDTIWNAGGWLLPGGIRRYSGANDSLSSLPQSGVERRSFITGCSMFLRSSILSKAGMLSEDFFFGEEDIEYSLRLRTLRLKMVCIYGAIVAHKVSRSARKISGSDVDLCRAYVQYLNRLVHYRRYMSTTVWRSWKVMQLGAAAVTLVRVHRVGQRVLRNFIRALWRESEDLTSVGRETFFTAMRTRWT